MLELHHSCASEYDHMAASQHYLQSNVFKRNESKLQQAIQFKAEVLLNVVITL